MKTIHIFEPASLIFFNNENEVSITCSEISDGYHSFSELYDHRNILFLNLCKSTEFNCWRSKFHDNGSYYPGWFLVGIDTPHGTISYHLPETLWDCANFMNTLDKAPPWDGYTSDDVLKRLKALL